MLGEKYDDLLAEIKEEASKPVDLSGRVRTVCEQLHQEFEGVRLVEALLPKVLAALAAKFGEAGFTAIVSSGFVSSRRAPIGQAVIGLYSEAAYNVVVIWADDAERLEVFVYPVSLEGNLRKSA